MNTDNKYLRDKASVMSMIRFILMVSIIAVICFCATKIVAILIPFFLGFLLARTSLMLGTPFIKLFSKGSNKLAHSKKLKKAIVTTIYYVLLVIIAILAVVLIYELIGQATTAFENITNYILSFDPDAFYNGLMDWASKYKGLEDIIDNYQGAFISLLGDIASSSSERIPGLLSSFITGIWNTIGNIPYWIFVIVCVIFSGHYFINDSTTILKLYYKIVPNKEFRERSVNLIDNLANTLFRAIGGYVALFAITSIEAYFILILAGVNYASILAIITGAIDFLPVLGVSATMVPVLIYCLAHGNIQGAIIIVIGLLVITIVRRLIEPPILGKSLHIHPLLMLVSMAAGVYIWGAIGFLLGPTVTIIIIDILKVFEFDKKILEFVSNVLSNVMPESKKSGSDIKTEKTAE